MNGRWCARRTTFSSCIVSASRRRDDFFLSLDWAQAPHEAIAGNDDTSRGRAARVNVSIMAITRTDS